MAVVNVTLQGPSVCESDLLVRRWTDNCAFNFRVDQMMNFGEDAEMRVGTTSGSAWRQFKNLMKWDFSSIPAGSAINSAVMSLYKYYVIGTDHSIDVHGMTRSYVHGPSSYAYHAANCVNPGGGCWWCDYDIGYVTYWYRQRPPSTTFGTFDIGDSGQPCHPLFGCDAACEAYCWASEQGPTPSHDCDASYTDRVDSSGPIDNWNDFDIQPLVSDWVNGVRSNLGLLLTWYSSGDDRNAKYRAPNYTGDTTKQPKIVINYEPPPETAGAVIMVV